MGRSKRDAHASAPPSGEQPHASSLSRTQADDVLRYWLAAVRLEETLKVRPRARRVKHESAVPRLDLPASGQEYFKLALDDALAGLLADKQTLERAFDGELAAFFEGWLLSQYRRGQEEHELSHLLCFPIVHSARGELAGLLRAGVRLRFGSPEGPAFRTPSRGERQRGAYPAPPSEVRIVSAPRSEGAWPFFIDTRLLSYPLGVSSEEIDALFDALRAEESVSERKMLTLVAETLERAVAAAPDGLLRAAPLDQTDSHVSALLERLRRAMQSLLARGHTRAEVYPVALVIDGTQAKTTWHLQRELTSLLEAQGEEAWPRESCLGAYLTQQALPAKVEAQRALFDVPALTASQRQAAEQFWGSRLTAVQGPPGTGKTTLILHLCAEALVRQVDHLLDHQTMGSALLLITSGNNRAVDNVLDPLSAGDGLPLALRVGSRQVCEQALCTRLRATAGWLERAQREPAPERARELEAALASFARERAELDLLLTPRRRALVLAAERERVLRALAALPAASRRKQGDASELPPSTARLLDEALAPLERRLLALSELCGAKPGLAQVNAIARHYEKTARRELPTLEAALLAADLQLEVPLPPLEAPLDARALMEAWEEGAETFLGQLSPIRERVQQSLRRDQRAQQEDELRRQLEALGPESDKAIPEAGGHDERSRALFSAALRVREAWAKEHAATLLESVSAALRIVEQERSLRPVFRDEPEHARQLCRLFGTWGSTLLSLGNCLPAEADSIARVVIDEAGQCHPAHAVSALLRSTAAMVIGDVHQLAPVIDLTLDDDARLLRSCRLRLDERALAPYRVSSDSQVSAQSVADRAVTRKLRLIDHFRCRPEIIAISDALCGYGLQVRTPARVGMDLLQHPVSLLDLKGEQQSLFGSLSNELELQETLRLVEVLLGRGAAPAELAVITPYRGQLERLRRGLLERGIPLELSPELLDGDGPTPHAAAGLALGTVHRFQGGERSIVLFSSVVTRSSSLGFLNARPNLLNVAISRARHHFVCLGHRSVLLQGDVTRVLAEAAWPLS